MSRPFAIGIVLAVLAYTPNVSRFEVGFAGPAAVSASGDW